MSREEFKQFILSIGFKYNGYYVYKEFVIYLYYNDYDFHNGSEWYDNNDINDLRLIENYFKRELRSIKLKNILG